MPKRKRHSEDNYEYLQRKMKKLERKILHARRRKSDSSSTEPSDYEQPVNSQDNKTIEIEPVANEEPSYIEPIPSTSAAADAADAIAAAAMGVTRDSGRDNPDSYDQSGTDTIQEQPDMGQPLDDEILAILGDDPSTQKCYGNNIHKDLTVRFEHIATTGLATEMRKELQNKYPPPANCTLTDAPALNPEIKAAVSETVMKRDKGIQTKQKQISNAISCIGQAITHILYMENKDPTLIKLLMDANRILCDCQYLDSVTRRNFILTTLKKDMKNQLQITKIDKYLFGHDFAESLKSAKAISKSGAELKSFPNVRSTVKKTKPVPAKNLNWKAPPPNRRPPGNQRNHQPVFHKSRRAPSSRASQQQPAQFRSQR